MNHELHILVPSLQKLSFEPQDSCAYPLYTGLPIHVECATALTLSKSQIEI